jgi:hypothetical protein
MIIGTDPCDSQSYKIILNNLEVSKIIANFANEFTRTGCTSAILSKLNGSRFAPSLQMILKRIAREGALSCA